jgi:GNAT superfamily N-acetyltransferase
MADAIQLTSLTPGDHEAVARLLHQALVHWYESRLRQGAKFGDSHEPFLLFPEVYEALDPGECVAARDARTQALLGVCFSHERETHVAVGIVATAPEASGRGVARRMMESVLEKARRLGKPARLVSSLLNLESFSLYTRLGFVTGAIFQDMLITVPENGMAAPAPSCADRVREARADEAARIADFEQSLQGIRREKDYMLFLRNEVGAWRVLVSERSDGTLGGFLAMSTHPSFSMIGPGVAADEETAAALLWRALDGLRGRTWVFLVPCAAAGLARTAYSWGARNVELHVAQSTAPVTSARGIVFPTFMPETA